MVAPECWRRNQLLDGTQPDLFLAETKVLDFETSHVHIRYSTQYASYSITLIQTIKSFRFIHNSVLRSNNCVRVYEELSHSSELCEYDCLLGKDNWNSEPLSMTDLNKITFVTHLTCYFSVVGMPRVTTCNKMCLVPKEISSHRQKSATCLER